MRCEECGRPIRNAEMWQLSGNRNAPSARSMRTMCWSCRESPPARSKNAIRRSILAQANEIVRQYQSGG